MTIPNVLTIAGSDSSGGAGIQADLKTFCAFRTYGMSVVTALTAQNTRGVTGVHLPPPDFVRAQIDAVFDDVRVDAVKIGMIANAEIASAVADGLSAHRPNVIVLDPVMVAKGGDPLLEPDAVAVIRERLMPLASIVTPNLAEAEVLIGQQPDFGHARSPHRSEERDDREGPGKRLAGLATQLLNLGSAAVYLKGGQRLYTSDAPHDPGAVSTSTGVDVQQVGGDRPRESIDVFHDGQQIHMLSGPLVSTRALHGTGCSLSSALASLLALGRSPFDAAREAKVWLTRAIERGSELDVGHPDGFGPVHHFHSKRSAASEPE